MKEIHTKCQRCKSARASGLFRITRKTQPDTAKFLCASCGFNTVGAKLYISLATDWRNLPRQLQDSIIAGRFKLADLIAWTNKKDSRPPEIPASITEQYRR